MSDNTGLLGEPLDKKARGNRRFKYYGERKVGDAVSIRLLHGDVREMLKSLPDKSVHCSVTSPPYYGLRDYGIDGQIGLEQTPTDYVTSLVEIFRELRRVLRDDGTFWLNIGDSFVGHNIKEFRAGNEKKNKGVSNKNGVGVVFGCKPKDLIGIPWLLAFALRDDGWYLRSDIIWSKPNSMPESVTDRPTSSHEHIFLLSKNEHYYYDSEAVKEVAATKERIVDRNATPFGQGTALPNGGPRFSPGARITTEGGYRNMRNVWSMASEPLADEHFAAFPSELPYRCILAGTSGYGCCAQCGTPWVRQMDREFVGDNTKRGNNYGDGSILNRTTMGLTSGKKIGNHKFVGWQASCQCDAPITASTVLDPFSGSGTTALVAAQLTCNVIGIELNQKYIDISRKRLEADVASLGLAKVYFL